MPTVIVIAIVLALGWFLLAVPQRRRSRMHAAMQDSLQVGDEIITAGGIHAVVRELAEAVRRTTAWAGRQRHAERSPGQLRFGINLGGTDQELRRRSGEEIAELDFDGNAIGGLAVGEDR